MKVSELLQGIPCTGTYNDVEVLDVTQDSRLVEPGYLFVCCLLYTSPSPRD